MQAKGVSNLKANPIPCRVSSPAWLPVALSAASVKAGRMEMQNMDIPPASGRTTHAARRWRGLQALGTEPSTSKKSGRPRVDGVLILTSQTVGWMLQAGPTTTVCSWGLSTCAGAQAK